MKLLKLKLTHFRQFKGEQEIVFSDVDERNVTLIHAENGFGKTALLNSILWGFYGHSALTPDLEKPESLVHEGTAAGGRDPNDIVASVEIHFEHDGNRYFLNRSLSLAQQRLDHRKTELALDVMREGKTFREPLPQQKINALVPQGISPRIFFNGERIDHLAMREHAKDVTEAIEQMLGLKLLRKAIDDLQHQSVRGVLRTELRDSTSDEKTLLLDQLSDLETAVERIKKDMETAVKNLDDTDEEIIKINQSLEKDREAAGLQKQREALGAREKQIEQSLEDVRKKLARLLAEDGYTLFGDDLVKRGKEIMTGLREQNMIPAPVIDSYLLELLEKGLCICERHLPKDSPEYEAVRRRLSIAPNQGFNNAVSALDQALGLIAEVGRKTRTQMTDLNRERLKLEENLKVLGEQVAEIHQRLGGQAGPDVAKLENKRTDFLQKQGEIKSLQGRLEQRLEDNTAEQKKLTEQISAIEDEEENARRAQRRLDALEDCVRVLEQVLAAEREELRPRLNDEINRHFQAIIDRDYWAELSEDFVLTIRKNVAGGGETDVAQSTGQRQITSLVFIGSLVALARQRDKIPTIIRGLSGSVYPLVMDSPFGQLGDRFTRGIARLLPSLASQVIILVTAKQYKGAVEQELRKAGRIGRRYMLVYQAPTLKEDAADELEVDGNRYQQYSRSDEEMTEIKPLE
jgi:DNA sulfur modification protein DndD